MRIAKFLDGTDRNTARVGVVEGDRVRPIASGPAALSALLHGPDVADRVGEALRSSGPGTPLAEVRLLAPLDAQEVWGAGVTYERSKVARQEESEQGGSFYDLVYKAPRPELFFKASPSRVVGPGVPIRVRRDTRWCVPEPELALVLSPSLGLVGFTVGNDVSARDIEGENPLYLPQAKVYDACCALGPYITLAAAMPPPSEIEIRLEIVRAGAPAFDGRTSVARMARRFEELIHWLGVDNVFPDGVVLLTGTGIVPPDEFTLQPGDLVTITIDGVGSLTNPVVQGDPVPGPPLTGESSHGTTSTKTAAFPVREGGRFNSSSAPSVRWARGRGVTSSLQQSYSLPASRRPGFRTWGSRRAWLPPDSWSSPPCRGCSASASL